MRISLNDLSPDTNYALQLRGKAGTNYSEWSKVFKFKTVKKELKPATPQNVQIVQSGTAFKITWDEVTTNEDGSPIYDLKGYKVYIFDDTSGEAPEEGDPDTRTKAVFETTDTFFDLTQEINQNAFDSPLTTPFNLHRHPRGKLSVQVSAIDLTGNESDKSEPVSIEVEKPPTPTNFVATGLQDSISLSWDAVNAEALAGYKLYMSFDEDFEPDVTNEIWHGDTLSNIYVTFLFGVEHFFKLTAYNVFYIESDPASASATPRSSFTVDVEAPPTPTGLSVSPAYNAADSSLWDATVTWDAFDESDGVTDLSGYRVRYRVTGSSDPWRHQEVPPDVTTTVIPRLLVGTTYDFQIEAFDYSANQSAYSAIVTGTMANSAPSKPSAPSLAGTTLAFAVSHDMQKAAGGQLESDVVALRVYTNTTDSYSGGTLVQTISVSQGSPVAVSEKIVGPSSGSIYVWVTAVDKGNLESPQSDRVPVTTQTLHGQFIEDATITNAKIGTVAANKIIAGSGIVNDLLIKSQLTVDVGGKIQSALYGTSGGADGFYLDDTNLIIKSGQIEARALRIQNSSNVVPPQYAGFEFKQTFYIVRAASGSSVTNSTITVDGASIGSIVVDISGSTYKFETQSLRIVNSSGGPRTVKLAATDNTYPVTVDTSKEYIVSAYVYCTTAFDVTLGVKVNSGADTSQTASIPANTWTRISKVIPAPASEQAQIYFTLPDGTMYVDGVQLEEKASGSTTPSAWKPPGMTSIDGGIIRTGEIRSDSNIYVNGVLQPAWSINTQGGMQIGNAWVRGSLVIGQSGDGAGSYIQSMNYVPGSTGWMIRSDGYGEFRNVAIGSASSFGGSLNYATGTLFGVPLNGYDLVAGSVGTNSLAANSITAGKIAANTITATHITTAGLTADVIKSGTISTSFLGIVLPTVSESVSSPGTPTMDVAGSVLFRNDVRLSGNVYGNAPGYPPNFNSGIQSRTFGGTSGRATFYHNSNNRLDILDNIDIRAVVNLSANYITGSPGTTNLPASDPALIVQYGHIQSNALAGSPSPFSTSSAANVFANSNGALAKSTASTARIKKNIGKLNIQNHPELDPSALYDLEVKEYKFRSNVLNEDDPRYEKFVIGFIAEEVNEVYPMGAEVDQDGVVQDWNHRYIIPAMMKLIQDQKKEIDGLKSRLDNAEI